VGSLRDQGLDVHLTIAGREPAAKELEQEASLHRQWLRLVNSPSIDQLVECYAESGVFVLATRNQVRPTPQVEGFGIVLAEAALAGVPAISSAIGGCRDAILDGVTGFLPPHFSTTTLTDALAWCIAHPTELANAGLNARTWAAKKYHHDAYRDTVARLLGAPAEAGLPSLGIRLGVV
jgi:glycosyltransferase involved in cell wall biosynthesis